MLHWGLCELLPLEQYEDALGLIRSLWRDVVYSTCAK